MTTFRAVLVLGLALVAGGCSERPQVVGAEPVETRSTRNVVVAGEASAVGPPRIASFVATVAVWAPTVDLAARECETLARRVRGQLQNVGVRGTDLVDHSSRIEAAATDEVHGSTPIVMEPAAAAAGEAVSDDDAAAEPAAGGAGPPPAAGTIGELAGALPPTRPEWGAPGFLAEESITVTVRDMSALPRVLERALSAGAARLGTVRRQPNNPELLVEKVRQRAVQDARARAQVLAQELAQTVGQANSIVEEQLVLPGDDPTRPYEARCRVRIDFTLRGF